MQTTVLARSLPYPTSPTGERICDRCGIQYKLSHNIRRDGYQRECKDCRASA